MIFNWWRNRSVLYTRGPVVCVYGHNGTHYVAGDYEVTDVNANRKIIEFLQEEKFSSLIVCSSFQS